MNSSWWLTAGAFLLGLAMTGCEKNLATGPLGPLGAPQNLKALSINSTTVQLFWSAAPGSSDSTFRGYLIKWGSVTDSVGSGTFTFIADSLTPGSKLFTVYAQRIDGSMGSGASISWAPATRFDSAYVVPEFDAPDATRTSGFHVGSQLGAPTLMTMGESNQQYVDLFFNGQGNNPLEMLAADQFFSSWNATRFSTQSDAAADLNFPLPAFPDASTFTQSSVALNDNTIYYARVVGTGGNVNYARLHVHLPGGTFPGRSVQVEVSLQRLVNLPFAAVTEDRAQPPMLASLAYNILK